MKRQQQTTTARDLVKVYMLIGGPETIETIDEETALQIFNQPRPYVLWLKQGPNRRPLLYKDWHPETASWIVLNCEPLWRQNLQA